MSDSKKPADEWLQFADDDLFTAKHMFSDVHPRKHNELDIDDAIAENNIMRAQKIYDFCVGKINKTDNKADTETQVAAQEAAIKEAPV